MHIQGEEDLAKDQQKLRGDIPCAQAQTMGVAASCNKAYRPSPAAEAEKNFHFHSEQASKAGMAAKFFAVHPEFAQFIELIREGAIRI